ncbi:MAG TPA: Gfo/Idh/MocA family oxidoreductase [Sedimentisphaerales bacterium]|nr:Gfo/Idh/MocA family oxidoreductase [Sedimentisphaerales bacterium]
MTHAKRFPTRRDFIKSMAAVGAGVFGIPYSVPSSVFGSVAPSNRINVGCIGTGNMGFTDLQGLMHQDDTQIVAVCDVNRGSYGYKTASQFRGREPARKLVNDYYAQKAGSGVYTGTDAYVDFRELLARDDIDAVSVTTPDHWHAIPTIMAAQAGKHIYCQKPLSLTIAEGRAMVEAVRRHGVILQTGSQHRSKERMRFACELVRNGRIGRVKRVLTDLPRHGLRFDLDTWTPTPVPDGFDYDLWLGPAPWAPHHEHRCFYTFRFLQDYSGGETTNTGAHKFDIVQWALGTERTGPVEIEDLGGEFPKTGLFDTVSRIHFRARYANDVELICTPDGVGAAVRFEGTEGWVHVDWNSFRTHPESLATTVIGPNEIHLYESLDHKRNFLDCIKSGRDPITPVEVGHRSASVCHLANIAMRLGRKLHWNPDEERFVGDDQANRLLSKPPRAPWHL